MSGSDPDYKTIVRGEGPLPLFVGFRSRMRTHDLMKGEALGNARSVGLTEVLRDSAVVDHVGRNDLAGHSDCN
jgi:hypothetical protein